MYRGMIALREAIKADDRWVVPIQAGGFPICRRWANSKVLTIEISGANNDL